MRLMINTFRKFDASSTSGESGAPYKMPSHHFRFSRREREGGGGQTIHIANKIRIQMHPNAADIVIFRTQKIQFEEYSTLGLL